MNLNSDCGGVLGRLGGKQCIIPADSPGVARMRIKSVASVIELGNSGEAFRGSNLDFVGIEALGVRSHVSVQRSFVACTMVV